MPTIIPDTAVDNINMDAEITYIEKRNIYRDIHQKLRKKDVYENDMHNIYNLILDQTNDQLQEKAALYVTFQSIKTSQDPNRYLMILNRLFFSNQSEQHPIWYLCIKTRQLYNTIH